MPIQDQLEPGSMHDIEVRVPLHAVCRFISSPATEPVPAQCFVTAEALFARNTAATISVERVRYIVAAVILHAYPVITHDD